MIDFACKEFDLREIIKCSLGLTRAELQVLEHIFSCTGYCTTERIAAKVKLDTSTVQRTMKKLHAKGVVERKQRNRSGGGYEYAYRALSKATLKDAILGTVVAWTSRVEAELTAWAQRS